MQGPLSQQLTRRVQGTSSQSLTSPSIAVRYPPAPGNSWGFGLFILLNLVLFVRPAEILPILVDVPIYECVILSCLAVCLPAVLRLLSPDALAARPINVFVLGMLPAVLLSHLSHGSLVQAGESGLEFVKNQIYFLLSVAVLNTPQRLVRFLACLPVFVLALTIVALAQHHGLIELSTITGRLQGELDPLTGEVHFFPRLRGTGILNDPNDLCMILVTASCICLHYAAARHSRFLRALCLLLLAVFGYAIMLTHSRGGMLALLASLLIYSFYRFGPKKAVFLCAVLLPVLLAVFGGRQTHIDLTDRNDTAQERIQIWRDGLELLKESPVFGIGYGEYGERLPHVAHNSFVHCYTELGLFGGTLFTASFYCAWTFLGRVAKSRSKISDPRLAGLAPCMIAIVTGYVASMFSLSRAYIAPTYMVLSLASAYSSLIPATAVAPVRLTGRLVRHLLVVSFCLLTLIYVFVRLFTAF